MSRYVEYAVVTAADGKDLTRKVNARLEQGWEPFGSPLSHAGQLLQAVVMREAQPTKRIRKTSED
jgi:hypothetical protein